MFKEEHKMKEVQSLKLKSLQRATDIVEGQKVLRPQPVRVVQGPGPLIWANSSLVNQTPTVYDIRNLQLLAMRQRYLQ